MTKLSLENQIREDILPTPKGTKKAERGEKENIPNQVLVHGVGRMSKEHAEKYFPNVAKSDWKSFQKEEIEQIEEDAFSAWKRRMEKVAHDRGMALLYRTDDVVHGSTPDQIHAHLALSFNGKLRPTDKKISTFSRALNKELSEESEESVECEELVSSMVELNEAKFTQPAPTPATDLKPGDHVTAEHNSYTVKFGTVQHVGKMVHVKHNTTGEVVAYPPHKVFRDITQAWPQPVMKEGLSYHNVEVAISDPYAKKDACGMPIVSKKTVRVPAYDKGTAVSAAATMFKKAGMKIHGASHKEELKEAAEHWNHPALTAQELIKRHGTDRKIKDEDIDTLWKETGKFKNIPSSVKGVNAPAHSTIRWYCDYYRKHPENLSEASAGTDHIAMTVPLFIRCLEWAKEEAKNDVEIHQFVERVVSKNGTLSTDDYLTLFKEEYDQLSELSQRFVINSLKTGLKNQKELHSAGDEVAAVRKGKIAASIMSKLKKGCNQMKTFKEIQEGWGAEEQSRRLKDANDSWEATLNKHKGNEAMTAHLKKARLNGQRADYAERSFKSVNESEESVLSESIKLAVLSKLGMVNDAEQDN